MHALTLALVFFCKHSAKLLARRTILRNIIFIWNLARQECIVKRIDVATDRTMVINAAKMRHIIVMAAHPVATIEITISIRLPDRLAARTATITGKHTLPHAGKRRTASMSSSAFACDSSVSVPFSFKIGVSIAALSAPAAESAHATIFLCVGLYVR